MIPLTILKKIASSESKVGEDNLMVELYIYIYLVLDKIILIERILNVSLPCGI